MVDIFSIMKQYGVLEEPPQQSIQLSGIKEEILKNPAYLTPANFGEFVTSGSYRKVVLPDSSSSYPEDRFLIITGCGRSGTSLFLKLILTQRPFIKLDEPRELYMSLYGEEFDIWSVKSIQRSGKIKPTQLHSSFTSVLRAFSPDSPIHYIEKTPEHILRFESILKICPKAKFVYMQRDWISVALSIWEITNKSKKPIRWYGAGGCKWKSLVEQTPFTQVEDVFVRATLEWIFSEQAYQRAVSQGVEVLKISYELLLEDPETVSKLVREFTHGDFEVDIDLSLRIIKKDRPSFDDLKNFLIGAETDFKGNTALREHLTKVRQQIPEDLIKKFLI